MGRFGNIEKITIFFFFFSLENNNKAAKYVRSVSILLESLLCFRLNCSNFPRTKHQFCKHSSAAFVILHVNSITSPRMTSPGTATDSYKSICPATNLYIYTHIQVIMRTYVKLHHCGIQSIIVILATIITHV